MGASSDRMAAGDVTDAEAAEFLLDVLQKLRDVDPVVACVLDSDRVEALIDRMAAGEQVDHAELRAAGLDAITNMDGLDSDRVKALVDRIEAGEEVDDAEVDATVRDAMTNMDGTAG